MPDDEPFSRAGDVLKDLFDRIVPEETGQAAGLFSGWEQIAGSETAMHVVPRDLVNHALILEADHPGWSQRIRMRQETLLQDIRSRYPELDIRRIRIRVESSRKTREAVSKTDVSSDIAEKHVESGKKTPPIAESTEPEEMDANFRELLEKLRRHGNS